MFNRFRTILSGMLLALTATVASAQYVEYDEATHNLTIWGYTTNSQAVKVHHIMREHEVASVTMYGPGGDAYAGLEIGKAISAENTIVIVPEDKGCYSACAFAALAGRKVFVDGGLWLHRPYTNIMPAMVSPDTYAQHMALAILDFHNYLTDNGFRKGFMRYIVKNTSPCRFVGWEDGVIINDKNNLTTPIVELDAGCARLNELAGY